MSPVATTTTPGHSPEQAGPGTSNGVIASFDIFDTVLTRVVTNPTSVWLLLGKRLAAGGLIETTPEAFMR
ncbi:MAG: hypothetical protein H0X65_12830, partial [Gemmatimonadetes bacterium]|nr:hypothetical protein [Gemmatimonadota bacterium]